MTTSISAKSISEKPISATRAAWLLIRLRLRRQWNQVAAIYRFRAGAPDRKTASRRSPTTWLVTAFVGLAMVGSFANLASQGISNFELVLGTVPVNAANPGGGETMRQTRVPGHPNLQWVPPAPGSVLSAGVQQGVTLAATLLLIVALLITMANREIARPEWDLEWLVTLPLSLSTLLVIRLIERVVGGAAGFVALAPFLSVLAWTCGLRWSAPLAGIGLTVPLLFLLATVQMLYDTGLRLSLSPSRLRNVQALMSVIALPPLFVAMSPAISVSSFVFGWVSALPAWVAWLPPGLAVRSLASADGWFWFMMMTAQIAVFVVIGLMALARQLRNGVVAAGAREAVMRKPSPRRQLEQRPALRPGRTGMWTPLSPVQRRELVLLARDRTFMVQTLLVPALMVGAQIFANSSTGLVVDAASNPVHLAAITFGLAATTLAFSALQTLNAEGQALWILYCVPHSLDQVLRQKAKFWAAVAAIYPVVMFAGAVVMARDITMQSSIQLLGLAIVVLVGVPIFATIATALGVFACDPLEQDIRRRVRVTYFYIYMLLASLYAYAIYATSVWQRLASITLTALVAMALWQKARDRFDYLLDPSASPPPRISVSDGLIAALIFFVLQALVVALQLVIEGTLVATAGVIWIAFCGAGAVTYGLMRLVYWRSGASDVPRMFGKDVGKAMLWGIVAGALAALVGVVYLQVITSLDLFPEARQIINLPEPSLATMVAAMIIVAAPIFEEFIFRGLIFGGLRRSLDLPVAAIASAAIFAIVHPPASVIPVFVLGLCTALAYERTRMLAAPIVVHMVYNAAVMASQWSAAN